MKIATAMKKIVYPDEKVEHPPEVSHNTTFASVFSFTMQSLCVYMSYIRISYTCQVWGFVYLCFYQMFSKDELSKIQKDASKYIRSSSTMSLKSSKNWCVPKDVRRLSWHSCGTWFVKLPWWLGKLQTRGSIKLMTEVWGFYNLQTRCDDVRLCLDGDNNGVKNMN